MVGLPVMGYFRPCFVAAEVRGEGRTDGGASKVWGGKKGGLGRGSNMY